MEFSPLGCSPIFLPYSDFIYGYVYTEEGKQILEVLRRKTNWFICIHIGYLLFFLLEAEMRVIWSFSSCLFLLDA